MVDRAVAVESGCLHAFPFKPVGLTGEPARFLHGSFTSKAIGLAAMTTPATLRSSRLPRTFAVLLALLAMLVPAAVAHAGTSEADPAGEQPAAKGAGNKVVFIGAPGLAWSDVSQETTPAIWDALGGSVGSLSVRSVRTVACPLDGWLAVNTSVRAAGTSAQCDVLVDPVDSSLPVWPHVEEALEEQSYSAELGALTHNLREAGASSLAIGPGAGVALANEIGHVLNYEDRRTPGEGLAAQLASAVSDHDLVIVDAGPIRPAPKDAYSTPEQFRADHIRIINNRIEAILRGLHNSGEDATVILAGLADDAEPALRMLAISGEGWPRGELSSPSTRQPGYSLATDLHATILTELGIEGTFQGGAIHAAESSDSLAQLAADARDRERHSKAMRPIIPTFFTMLVVLNVGLYAAVAIGLKRPNISKLNAWWHRRIGKVPPQTEGNWLPPRTNVLRVMRVIALSVAALPVASYLANFVPWWRTEVPGLALTGTILAVVGGLVALSLAGPWRRAPLGPATVIAGVLALLLGLDVVFGSPLQLGSVMGNPPLVAGRFYGMNNTAFAQFTTAMILLAIAAAQPFVRRGHRRIAALIIAVFGTVTAFIDGAPFLGADFGGPPAILPAFLILALLAAGVRLTIKRVGVVFIGTALIVIAIAFVDWLRPPSSRTHIGNFFQQVLDGELLTVIWRKLDANLRVLMGNRPLTILAASAVALVVFVLARPIRTEITEPKGGRFAWLSGGTPVNAMTTRAPLLGSALVAAAILAALGMAANDSGIAIPANVAAVLVPSLIAATATWMLNLELEPTPPLLPDSPLPRSGETSA